MNIAIIPAAGLGSRLGIDKPKILEKVKNRFLIEYIIDQIERLFDKIIVVVSPMSLKNYELEIRSLSKKIEIMMQEKPIGMGDAIFGCYSSWKNADKIVIIWGDQVLIRELTVKETLDQITLQDTFVIPLTTKENPYVEYVIDKAKLVNVLQSREGDQLNTVGKCDVGVFGFNSKSLHDEWLDYLSTSITGRLTKEINFLPFLVFLSKQGWNLKEVNVKNSWESLGINDQTDLIKVEQILRSIEDAK